MSAMIYQKWNYGLTTEATVMCVVLTAITITLAVLVRGVGGKAADV
jgi:ABC-type sulfate transport system permease component